MTTATATTLRFTDEQRAFREAIRDFCAERECGTTEQRERLTQGYGLHNQEIYEKLADLGWLGVSIDEEYGGSGGGNGGRASSWRTARPGPDLRATASA